MSTPNDDGDALYDLIWGDDDAVESLSIEGAIERILAAGFRRTEVPEPSAGLTREQRHTLVEGAVDAIERNATNRTHAYNIWNNLASDERFVRAIMTLVPNRGTPEPQGEPSDAQLQAAAEAFSLAPFWNDEDGVLAPLRAALRAAGGVR